MATLPSMPLRLAIANQKGGVGKTTTAVNLAAVLAARGLRVLLIDFDPQGNASQFLGLVEELEQPGLYTSAEFTLGQAAPVFQRTTIARLDLLPANDRLAHIEGELLQNVFGGVRRLSTALRAVEHNYDAVIADCAPSLGMLTLNALVACPNVLVPVKLAPASVLGAINLQRHLASVRERVEPQLRLVGVLGTFFKETGLMARDVLSRLDQLFGPALFRTSIHASDSVERSAGKGAPLFALEPGRREAVEYELVADELLTRLAALQSA